MGSLYRCHYQDLTITEHCLLPHTDSIVGAGPLFRQRTVCDLFCDRVASRIMLAASSVP
jgi:hypothetical protein